MQTTEKPRWLEGRTLTLAAGVFSFSLLFVMIASSPRELRYDEVFHLGLTSSVTGEGWYIALTDPGNGSAAGPLYPALHLAFGGVSDLQAPLVRWPNFILLAAATLLIGLTRPNVLEQATISFSAFSIMAVPFLWTPAGLALTEVPALAAFSGFLLIVGRLVAGSAKDRDFSGWTKMLAAGIAGALLGVAILGRQTYLVALPALVVLFFLSPRLRLHLLLSFAAALLVSGWLFAVWGGLVPPSKTVMNSGLQPLHGMMSLAYLAAATLFISPRFLIPPNYRVVVVAVTAGVLLAVLLYEPKGLPAGPLLSRLVGQSGATFAGLTLLAGMFSIGLLWLWNLPVSVWERRADAFQIFCALILVALALTPITISNLFSSRYLVGMLGVLVLVLQPAATRGLAMRIVAGSLIGAATLYVKYHP